MEDVDCLLCGSRDKRIWLRGFDRMHEIPGEFNLVECRQCQFLYLSPRPDQQEILEYYPEDYVSYRPAVYEEPSLLRGLDRLRGLRQRCAAIRNHRKSGDLLDVGCGTGDFLAVMRSYPGWRVQGLEPQAAAAARARAKYGLAVDVGSLDTVPYAPGSFDVVTMWDVLEHVPSPLDALRRIHGLIRPGGIVVLGLPNRESWDARLFGAAWAGYDIPRHFSVFSPAHVEQALRHAGFTDTQLVNLTGSYYVGALSARFLLAGSGRSKAGYQFLHRAITSLPGRLVFFPYTLLAKQLRRASIMTIISIRRDEMPPANGFRSPTVRKA